MKKSERTKLASEIWRLANAVEAAVSEDDVLHALEWMRGLATYWENAHKDLITRYRAEVRAEFQAMISDEEKEEERLAEDAGYQPTIVIPLRRRNETT